MSRSELKMFAMVQSHVYIHLPVLKHILFYGRKDRLEAATKSLIERGLIEMKGFNVVKWTGKYPQNDE